MPQGHAWLLAELATAHTPGTEKRLQEVAAIERALSETRKRKARLVRQLEERDDPDGTLFADIRERIRQLDELDEERRARLAVLTAGDEAVNDPAAIDLVDELIVADIDVLRAAPEPVLRRLFDAFQLRMTYDWRTGHAVCRVVVRDDTIPAANGALQAAQAPHGATSAPDGLDSPDRSHGRDHGPHERPARRAGRSHLFGALGRIRTCAPGSGGRCSIP